MPQSRHRVFIICVRSDLAASLPDECLPRLESGDRIVSVNDVIGVMPKLRSRLSRGDNPGAWQDAVREACDLVEEHQLNMMNPSARVDLGSRSKDRLPSICATRTGATDTGRDPFVRYHRLRLTATTQRVRTRRRKSATSSNAGPRTLKHPAARLFELVGTNRHDQAPT